MPRLAGAVNQKHYLCHIIWTRFIKGDRWSFHSCRPEMITRMWNDLLSSRCNTLTVSICPCNVQPGSPAAAEYLFGRARNNTVVRTCRVIPAHGD